MERPKVIDLLIRILADLDFDIEPCEHNIPLSDLGINSLEFVELTMKVETAFGITILESEAVRLSTVNNFADFILTQPRFKRL